MLSTVLELAGASMLTAAAYLLAGPVGALVFAGVILLVASVLVESGLRTSTPAKPARRAKKPVRLESANEALTNAELDALMAAHQG